MPFEKLYVPNKLRNKVVEEICFDLNYVREYYQREPLEIYDYSNTTSIKVDLNNKMMIYMNDDNTADINLSGPGLSRNVPVLQVLMTWVIQ